MSNNIKNKNLIEDSTNYVRDLLETNLAEDVKFHTWTHTEFVLEEAEEIAAESKCTPEELEILQLGALFHDIGYIEKYEEHEDVSIRLAKEYLSKQSLPEAVIEKVVKLIEATKSSVRPATKLQRILVDADLAHLGKKNYAEATQLLLEERNLLGEEKLNTTEWNQTNIDFLKSHKYKTKAARRLYKKRKVKNIKKLKKDIKKLEIQNSISKNKAAQIIFKTSLRNHIDLTSIADKKANIMLSINALILSLGMPLFARYLIDEPQLMKPATLFLITSGITMILATMATRPVKTDGKTNLDNLYSGKSNLFFFGNFYKLKIEDYHEGVKRILANQKALDDSIVNDLYFLGIALGNKFKMLRLCYTFFAVGLAITFLAFIVCYFYYKT